MAKKSLDDRPDLDAMQKFTKKNGDVINILTKIGAQHQKFGIHLLNDGQGEIMAEIMSSPSNRAATIKMEIVEKWLRGEGKEVSWEALAAVLDTIGLKLLAQDIRAADRTDEPNFLTLEDFEKQNGDTVNIIDSIGADYMNFGIHLLEDHNGTITTQIADHPRDSVANVKRVVVTNWLRGSGKTPVSWMTLAKVFDTMRLKILARDIRDALTEKSVSAPIPPGERTLANSPGLAILVTCDYETNKKLGTLLGTRVDATEMKTTFNHLNFAIHQLQNPTKSDIETLLEDVSKELSSYSGELSNKVIAFAYSGHGGNELQAEQIYANDGEKLDIMDEIVFRFVEHEAVAKIPKLFFIDACRGSDVLTKGAGNADAKSTEQYFKKGVQRVQGNYRMDYSTIPDHVSYAGSGGSLWMPKLARALKEQVDSVQNISANVKREVHELLEQRGQEKQQCETVSRLNCGALYLQQKK